MCCDCPSITIITPEADYNDISWYQQAIDQSCKTKKQESFWDSLMDFGAAYPLPSLSPITGPRNKS